MTKKPDFKLDADEKALLASIERGEWKPVKNMEAEVKRYQAIFRAHLRKIHRVNIRLSDADLRGLQARAVEEGMPYQTLMASILHKYLTGRLVEKRP